MSFEAWLLFCITETVLCFTPGPAVLFVVSSALARGAAAGIRGSLGILAANAAYFLISATSLGALLFASEELFTVVKWLGAAYLIWRGFVMVVTSKPLLADGANKPDPGALGAFASGFLTQGINPKAIVFFSAILPQFIDPRQAVGVQLAILGVSSIVIEFVVLSIYVALCHQTRGLAQARFAGPLERIAGVLLIAVGARLAVTTRA